MTRAICKYKCPSEIFRRAFELTDFFCLREHILDKYTVAACRVINENVRHGTDEASVLQNG